MVEKDEQIKYRQILVRLLNKKRKDINNAKNNRFDPHFRFSADGGGL